MSGWIAADWPAPENIVAGTTLRDYPSTMLPVDGTACWMNQVHGAQVIKAGDYAQPPDADASHSDSNDIVCVVKTADCLPVLMCSKDGGVFAAAHAGWRGLVAGVIENTVQALSVSPAELLVWLGPAISQPAFEVGDEVREAFVVVDARATECFVANDRGRWQADLYDLARQRLDTLGVKNIFGGGFCTHSDEERFFSYRRRDREHGRLFSFVTRSCP